MVSDLADSPNLTLSILVQPSTSSATSSPKSRLSCAQRVVGVLDGVVQQGRAQRRLVHAQLGQDRGDGERVGDVGVAALAQLTLVQLLRRPVGPLDQVQVGLGVVGPDHPEQRVQGRGLRPRPVLSRASRCRIRTRGCSWWDGSSAGTSGSGSATRARRGEGARRLVRPGRFRLAGAPSYGCCRVGYRHDVPILNWWPILDTIPVQVGVAELVRGSAGRATAPRRPGAPPRPGRRPRGGPRSGRRSGAAYGCAPPRSPGRR